MTTYRERALAAIAAFYAQQNATYAAWLRANPLVATEVRQLAGYDAVLKRHAVLNGVSIPAHRRRAK